MAQPQTVEHFVAGYIAELDGIAFAAGLCDRINVGLYRQKFLIMGDQQVGDQLADPAKADNDCLLGFNLLLIRSQVTAAAHFHSSGNVMAEPGQQWCDGQADCGHDLPECCSLWLDQLRLHRRSQYDQRGFRGTGHQNAGFGSRACPSTGKTQQAAGNGSLDHNHADDRSEKACPVFKDNANIDLHANGYQKHAKR